MPLTYTDPLGLYWGEGLVNKAVDWLAPGGASTEDIQAGNDRYCQMITEQRDSGKISQECFAAKWNNSGCGGTVAGEILVGAGGDIVDAATDPHAILDALGMIPVLGEPADILNAALYLTEAEYTLAGLSFAATIPLLGNAITTSKRAIKVIGRLDNTKNFKGVDGFDVLDDPNWSKPRNDAWVMDGVKNKQDFYMATDPNAPGAL